MHLLLDEPRYNKISRRAERQGASLASIIRQAIDLLPEDDSERRSAVQAILDSEPIDVPDDPTDLRRELDEIRAGAVE